MTRVPSRVPCRGQAKMDRNPFGMHKRQRGRRTGPSLVVSLSGPCQARLLSGGQSCSSWSSKTNSTSCWTSCSKTSSSWSSTRSSSWNWSSSSTSCWMSCLRQAADARQSSPLPAYRAWPLGPGHPARRPSPALRWRALSLSSSSSCHSPVGQDRLWDGQQENGLATDLFRRFVAGSWGAGSLAGASRFEPVRRLRRLVAVSGFGCAAALIDREEWLGRQDSNLGMAVPKTAALPLGDAPPWGGS
jgi:hypothetical protein